ncbi:thiol peroxidase [Mesonia aestuariivivens]|uniref:Thiol peroxidase n=1 Tax=Mesonia aestuariivivens TaxID=2796128 RepID=A0ABS6W2F3_9FLAO|nr:thiol peroxidase [Mesonia aestuariivivens]MBW2962030.1 thiol peroxidase [Mesonia aestuariivivens]
MANITLKGEACKTVGNLPEINKKAPEFQLLTPSLEKVKLSDYSGKRLILNIFPSIDTNVCATSVRNFNQRAKDLNNTEVLCVSRDLPFAQKRFIEAEELKEVKMLSDFQNQQFGKDYGLEIENGPFKNLLSRVVIVVDEDGKVLHSQQVKEIADEPDYLSALKTLL